MVAAEDVDADRAAGIGEREARAAGAEGQGVAGGRVVEDEHGGAAVGVEGDGGGLGNAAEEAGDGADGD